MRHISLAAALCATFTHGLIAGGALYWIDYDMALIDRLAL